MLHIITTCHRNNCQVATRDAIHNTVLSRVDERFALSLRYYPAGSSVALNSRREPVLAPSYQSISFCRNFFFL